MKTILEAVMGSNAFGLAHEGSDVDLHGIYVESTDRFLCRFDNGRGLELAGITENVDTIVTKDPDTHYHEVGKFVKMALQGRPNALELLYAKSYVVTSTESLLLIHNRDAFLSEEAVKNSYIGYALNQARKLLAREANGKKGFGHGVQTEKNARHLLRLLIQGYELVTTGTMKLDVSGHRDRLFEVGKLPSGEIMKVFQAEADKLKYAESVLPSEPNYARVATTLKSIRRMN